MPRITLMVPWRSLLWVSSQQEVVTFFVHPHSMPGQAVTTNVVSMTTSTPVPAVPAAAPSPESAADSVIDRLVKANRAYAAKFADPGMDARPVLHVAVVACMDARL